LLDVIEIFRFLMVVNTKAGTFGGSNFANCLAMAVTCRADHKQGGKACATSKFTGLPQEFW
jgi:hypothetical protein